MDIERRDFFKGCVASSVLLLVGMDNAAKAVTAHQAPVPVDNIEKSIKASFGGSFSLQGHAHSHGLTYANIEHCGNRYAVASADLLDWKIVRTSV
jgi:hypothetical protein